jgi:hypothetical protein
MKKKFLIIAMLLGSFTYSNAQSIGSITKAAGTTATKQATTVASNSFDVAGISNQVMGLLTPKLKLTTAQKPAVNSLVNELLNKKKSFLPLAATDKNGYNSKMTGLRNLFPSKMKGILGATQYASLIGIMPKSASSTSVLTKMLY